MAGLRMRWIDDTDVMNPVPKGLALRAYDRLGKWAFAGNNKWKRIINAKPGDRLHVMAEELRKAFDGKTPRGAPHVSPRILIQHSNSVPASPTKANVEAYHKQHWILIEQDGEDYTKFLFKADPLAPNPGPYMRDHSLDVDETDEDDQDGMKRKERRAQRMFAMMLMTKCR